MSLREIRRIAVITLSALALAHCAQNPSSGDKGWVPITEQQEIDEGAQAHQAVLKEYAALDNPALQAYVNEVGQRLAKQSPRPNLPWHFTVVDSPDVNAFALPGGYVYLTRGILAYLNSEAELASVIGHEIGHVVARHGLRLPSAPPAAEPYRALGSVLTPGAADQVGVRLVQTLTPAWTAGYGREDEGEADRRGAEYLAKAGYDPQAMVEAVGTLKNQERFAERHEGHPLRTYHGAPDPHDARLRQAVDAANQYAAANPRAGRSDYLKRVAGLVFGDSPDQGVLRNNLLLHDKLGLAIQFPDGWRVRNRADRVVATNPPGDALVELQQGPKNDKPLETLQNGIQLDPGARYDSGSLGGYPAAFAAGAQQGKPVVVAAVMFNGTQYLIAGMTLDKPAYDRERSTLRAAINSFRAITPAEKQTVRPYVLQLVTAQPGTTMAGLARQSRLGPDAERQLRVMNDLYPSGEPKPGQLLKIVR